MSHPTINPYDFQDPLSSGSDSAREADAASGVARRELRASSGFAPDTITPENFALQVHEAQMRDGRKSGFTLASELPPEGNTGVTITNTPIVFDPQWYKRTSTRTVVDTIEGTFPTPDIDTQAKLIEHYTKIFGGGADVSTGLRGYPYQRICVDGAKLLWDPNRLSQGLHIILSGKACQLHALLNQDADALLCTFMAAMEHKFNCTRFDIACDTTQVSMAQVQAAVDSGYLVSRAKKGSKLQSFVPSTGEDLGATIYIGSGKSDRMTRFYDKATEQGILDAIITRCEVQFRRAYANIAFCSWLKGKVDPESLLASAVDFRLPDDSNTTRRTRCDWWAEWLGNFPKFNMTTVDKIEQSVTRSLEWVRKQVAPTFAFLLRAMPDAEWIADLDKDGERRMTMAMRLIVDYRDEYLRGDDLLYGHV